MHLCLTLALIIGAGCQKASQPRPSVDVSFSDLWNTYLHCQRSEDPHEMKADALRLDQTVSILSHEVDARLAPANLDNLVSDRPSRLAVDPKAMAASCALLAGYQARLAGRPELAGEMFGHILANYSVDRYRYYVVRAYDALQSLTGGERFMPEDLLPDDLGS